MGRSYSGEFDHIQLHYCLHDFMFQTTFLQSSQGLKLKMCSPFILKSQGHFVVQYNITKYFGSKTLNMRNQKHISANFLIL